MSREPSGSGETCPRCPALPTAFPQQVTIHRMAAPPTPGSEGQQDDISGTPCPKRHHPPQQGWAYVVEHVGTLFGTPQVPAPIKTFQPLQNGRAWARWSLRPGAAIFRER